MTWVTYVTKTFYKVVFQLMRAHLCTIGYNYDDAASFILCLSFFINLKNQEKHCAFEVDKQSCYCHGDIAFAEQIALALAQLMQMQSLRIFQM